MTVFAGVITALMLNPVINARELESIDSIVDELCGSVQKIPVVEFASISPERDLAFLGKYFFGKSLSKDMAEVDTGRYLYFNNGHSRLWYYPASGAFEWVKADQPVAFTPEFTDDVMLELNIQAMNLIKTLQQDTPYPGEVLEFVKSSKVTVHTGDLQDEVAPTKTWLRRVDMNFQQKLASVPDYAGHRVSVSFCGDMEVCRVKMHLRPIINISSKSPMELQALQNAAKTSLSKMDGPYYVDHIATDAKTRIGYRIYSRSYSQKAAVPYIMIPVCLSRGGHNSSNCEMRSSVTTPLIEEPGKIVKAHRAEIKRNRNLEMEIVERPAICDQFPDRKECAP